MAPSMTSGDPDMRSATLMFAIPENCRRFRFKGMRRASELEGERAGPGVSAVCSSMHQLDSR